MTQDISPQSLRDHRNQHDLYISTREDQCIEIKTAKNPQTDEFTCSSDITYYHIMQEYCGIRYFSN